MVNEASTTFKGAGGTSGGVGEFVVGFALAVAGAYLLAHQVLVTSGFWYWGGYSAFGLSLIPILLGVAILFFKGTSVAGWLLTLAGAVIIFAGILTHLEIYFRPTSLFNTLLMLVMMFAGLGLITRSLKPHGDNLSRERETEEASD